MKPAALILCLAGLPALAIDQAGDKINLTDDDKATLKTCTTANPCAVWSLDEIKALLVLYRQKLVESGTGCRRDSI